MNHKNAQTNITSRPVTTVKTEKVNIVSVLLQDYKTSD